MTRIASLLAVAGWLAWTIPAFARPTDEQKCEAAKLRAAGKKASCLAKEMAKLALERAGDPAKCDARFEAAFTKAEQDGCGTAGDSGTVASRIGDFIAVIDAVLDPGGPFQDNGDGTVTDSRTGLQWEKKVAGAGCLHCVEDLYYWSGASAVDPDGDVFTEVLAALNTNAVLVAEIGEVAPSGLIIPPILLVGCFANTATGGCRPWSSCKPSWIRPRRAGATRAAKSALTRSSVHARSTARDCTGRRR